MYATTPRRRGFGAVLVTPAQARARAAVTVTATPAPVLMPTPAVTVPKATVSLLPTRVPAPPSASVTLSPGITTAVTQPTVPGSNVVAGGGGGAYSLTPSASPAGATVIVPGQASGLLGGLANISPIVIVLALIGLGVIVYFGRRG